MDGSRDQQKDLLLPLCFSTRSLELFYLCGGPRDALPDLLNFKVATELTFLLFVWKTSSGLLPFLFVSKSKKSPGKNLSDSSMIRKKTKSGWVRDKDIKYSNFQL